MPASPDIQIHADAHAAAVALADSFAARAEAAVRGRGRFSVALTGGSGPVEAFGLLGAEPYRSRIPWDGVHLFWGDERCVPPGHPRSNFGAADRLFVSRVPIPAANVHRMRGEVPPREGAAAYAAELEAFFGAGVPRFDLVHLGIGPDGHVCSLFPFTDPLRERDRIVTNNLLLPLGEWRITLTVPVLNAARRVEFIAPGAEKAAIVRTAVRGPIDPFRIPAQLVRPVDGELAWILDRAAAAGLRDHT
ncbi:MAG: 6-phosphogluconolactonase [Gemmatimonadetes bacterium]|nr:6-phosphogluconolactonase [Gemmatimonadota bacterium]